MSGTAIDGEHVTVRTNDPELSTRVIEAIAAETEADPLAMEPLYRVIDTDALDALFQGATQGVIRFAYDGHEIEAHSDGTVLVDGTEYGGN